MGHVILHDGEIENLLNAPSGLVYPFIRLFGKAVEARAKELSPVETGALKSAIDSDEPTRTAGMLTMTVGVPVLADDRGRRVDYAWIVHEGHGIIAPKSPGGQLIFKWRKRGKYFIGAPDQTVSAQASKPYLWEGLVTANLALPATERFALVRESIQRLPH